MTRQDIHRPSVVQPQDYEFVAYSYIGPRDHSDWAFLTGQKSLFHAHQVNTGGKWAGHDHGGTCHVCGATAFYTAIFHHKPTNEYIRTGEDCAEKMHIGDPAAFKKFRDAAHAEWEAKTGKAKALKFLKDEKLEEAWSLFETKPEDRKEWKYEERTVADIVSRLVRTGAMSTRAADFARSLLKKMAERPAKEKAMAEKKAQWEAEKLAAKVIPDVGKARVKISGQVLKVKEPDMSKPYPSWKMLVKHSDGWIVFGSVPSDISDDYSSLKGKYVSFEAKVQVSKDDPKFGFYSRPSKAFLIEKEEVTPDLFVKDTVFWNGLTIRNGKVVE